MKLLQEFEKQRNTLLEKNYPKFCGMSEEQFTDMLEALKKHISEIPNSEIDFDEGKLPFVIVVKSSLVDTEKAVEKTIRQGKQSFVNMFPHTPEEFSPIDKVTIPKTEVYLLMDIDRGKQTVNVRPDEALQHILNQHRSPLTIDEGVAILTHYPDFLQKNNCFSLLASRVQGNQRVPALWITQEKTVRLGWCWDRNPHTWLGSASCQKRLG